MSCFWPRTSRSTFRSERSPAWRTPARWRSTSSRCSRAATWARTTSCASRTSTGGPRALGSVSTDGLARCCDSLIHLQHGLALRLERELPPHALGRRISEALPERGVIQEPAQSVRKRCGLTRRNHQSGLVVPVHVSDAVVELAAHYRSAASHSLHLNQAEGLRGLHRRHAENVAGKIEISQLLVGDFADEGHPSGHAQVGSAIAQLTGQRTFAAEKQVRIGKRSHGLEEKLEAFVVHVASEGEHDALAESAANLSDLGAGVPEAGEIDPVRHLCQLVLYT